MSTLDRQISAYVHRTRTQVPSGEKHEWLPLFQPAHPMVKVILLSALELEALEPKQLVI